MSSALDATAPDRLEQEPPFVPEQWFSVWPSPAGQVRRRSTPFPRAPYAPLRFRIRSGLATAREDVRTRVWASPGGLASRAFSARPGASNRSSSELVRLPLDGV